MSEPMYFEVKAMFYTGDVLYDADSPQTPKEAIHEAGAKLRDRLGRAVMAGHYLTQEDYWVNWKCVSRFPDPTTFKVIEAWEADVEFMYAEITEPEVVDEKGAPVNHESPMKWF